MSTNPFTCPNCQHTLDVNKESVNTPINCPNCNTNVLFVATIKEDALETSRDINTAFSGILTVAALLGALWAAMLMGGWNFWTSSALTGGMIYLIARLFLNRYYLSKKVEYMEEETGDYIYLPAEGGRFNRLVNEALAELPKRFRDKLREINIVVEDLPGADTIKQLDLKSNRTLAGLYHGIPLTHRSVWHGVRLPDRITLFKKNIEAYCPSEAALKMEIQRVVRHELGHFFGFNEEELRRLEDGKQDQEALP